MPSKKPKPKAKTGPKPETLAIDANWRDAAKKAMKKGKPPKDEPVKKKRKKLATEFEEGVDPTE